MSGQVDVEAMVDRGVRGDRGTGDRLRPGPHSLTPTEVAASQRTRILAALTQLAAQHGIEETKVGQICKLAGVSNSAFYQLFANKEEALVAAYDLMADEVARNLSPPLTMPADWIDLVDGVLYRYLAILDATPDAARLFIREARSTGGAVRARRQEMHRLLASLIAGLHQQAQATSEGLRQLDDLEYSGLVEAIAGMVQMALDRYPQSPLILQHRPILNFVAAVLTGGNVR